MWAHSEQTAAGINGKHRNPRYLVGYELPGNVVATTDLSQALDGADAIIFAVPSTHLRSVCHQAAPFIAADTPVLCLTKGIEPESGLLMSEVIASEIGNEARVAALSGPNHAEEICRGGLSAAVIASEDPQIGETFKDLLLSTAFRIYLSTTILACVNKATFIYLQSLGRALLSTLLSMAREVLFGVGFALLLPVFFGLDGILLSMPVSDVLTFFFSVAVIVYTNKVLSKAQ